MAYSRKYPGVFLEDTRKHLRQSAGLPTQIRIYDLSKNLYVYGYISLLGTDNSYIGPSFMMLLMLWNNCSVVAVAVMVVTENVFEPMSSLPNIICIQHEIVSLPVKWFWTGQETRQNTHKAFLFYGISTECPNCPYSPVPALLNATTPRT